MGLIETGRVARVGLAEQVYETLEHRILNMEYQGGERLNIDQIARELGVSSTPARDALTRLSAERLVVFAPYTGFTVRTAPGPDELRESFDARCCIEVVATVRAASRLSAEDLSILQELNDKIANAQYTSLAESFLHLTRTNREFHRTIVSRCGNRFLVEAWENLNHDELVAFTLHVRGVPDVERIVEEHQAIIVALECDDSVALEQAVTRHILDGAQRVSAGMLANATAASRK